jgi:hypothetical protein
MPIYDGTNWQMVAWPEISQTTTDTTKSPAAVAASSVYDIFCWVDSGTNRCTRGPAWTNSTTRGYTLTLQNGILLNTSSITNGPGALRGTYVGTIASNASSTIDWTLGTSAAGGGAAVFNVWNNYNRVMVQTTVVDSTASYTYSAATIRQADASAGNQVSMVIGQSEDAQLFTYNTGTLTAVTQGGYGSVGIGLDSTSTYATGCVSMFMAQSAFAGYVQNLATCTLYPGIGKHVISANEASDSARLHTYNSGTVQNDGQNNNFAAYLRM